MINILFVEDNKLDQQGFERYVHKADLPYRYKVASSLAEAKAQLQNHSFDVVLADYQLGDGTAFELFDIVQQAPIVFITGVGDEELAVRAMRAGAYDYLIKDVDRHYLQILPHTVTKAIEHRQTEGQRELLSHAVQSTDDSIFITDIKDTILFVNRAFCQMYQYSSEEIVGKKSYLLWPDSSYLFSLPPNQSWQGELFSNRKDNSQFPVSFSVAPMKDDEGGITAVVNVVRDLTVQKQAEAAWRESEERYFLVAHGANDGLWDWNLITNEIYFSPRWKAMLGETEIVRAAHQPEDWFNKVHPQDRDDLMASIESHIQGQTSHFEHEHRIQHQDGTYHWMLNRGLVLRSPNGQAYRMAGSQSDITNRKLAYEQLQHAALHDDLTGLPNRASLMLELEKALTKKQTEHVPFALLFLDLDRFKVVNDSLGHLAGDKLLMIVAKRLRNCVRHDDVVTRLGGDEFVILLNGIERDEVTEISQQIQTHLGQPIMLDGQRIVVSASIGIAEDADRYQRAEEILRDADTAMYQAKQAGKNRHAFFQTAHRREAMNRMQMEADLRRAIEQQEFVVHYQPILSLATNQITGVEALLRWQHPRNGLLLPDAFIPVAEETGLLGQIGWWVLGTACEQTAVWHQAGYAPLRLAVNLSAQQLQDPLLVAHLDKILADTGFPPHLLELEIIETIATKQNNTHVGALHEIREMGVRLSIDDFGLDSSLDCLTRLPLDTLKIDQLFVKGMSSNQADAVIIKSIISIAHSLNLHVIAEGVETEDHLNFLRQENCDEIQGFLFSRPIAPEVLPLLLSSIGD